MRMIAKTYGLSDIGKVRKNNEDSFMTGRNCAVVADGMGGHRRGEEASRMAAQAFIDAAENIDVPLNVAFDAANARVYKKGQSALEFKGMGTTMVACRWTDNEICMANAGDSRGYLFRNGDLKQITKDHSFVQDLVDKGRITRSEAEKRPDKNIILRAVGAERSIETDLFDFGLEDGDRVLLCSDGLTSMVSDREVENILAGNGDIKIAAEKLVEKANEKGGKDNITVLLIEFFRNN